MKFTFNLILAFALLGTTTIFAQEGKVKKGNKKYEQYAFVDAQQAYLKVIDNGFHSADILQKLADSYYFTANYESAAKWYGALYENYKSDMSSEYLYRYAQSLKSVKRYETSNEIMEQFYAINGSDNRTVFFAQERAYLDKIAELERFEVSKVDFNSKLSDFAPSYYMDKLVFASNGRENSAGQRTHDWNEQPFLDLYIISNKSSEGKKNIDELSGKINTKFHESTAVFTKSGDTIYFTRNNYTKGKYRKDANGTNRLKLYRGVKKENGNWEIEELPFNNNQYSVAHPALSPDGKTLYFASDMPGGKGGSDLYKVQILTEGFSEPMSLGDAVNTKERETFPFVSADNKLYFSSDGHVGLGGLDVFVMDLDENASGKEVYNLGKPINSYIDDFSLIIDSNDGSGYFASNRKGGLGDDDIYSFKRLAPLEIECAQQLEGVVIDNKSKQPIENAKVLLLDEDNMMLSETVSTASGAFSFELDCSKAYSVRSTKDGYSTEEKTLASSSENNIKLERKLQLKKGQDLTVSPIKVGSDLAKILNLNPIYFDLDRYNIRKDAALELQKVIAVLKEYPTMKIDVRSHTDSRGKDSYNKILSERRAHATMNYIVETGGINRSRVTGNGYGETALVNQCSNGVQCADYVHEENRRSEFIVVAN
ncbi:OmpA family protein [Ulvibacter antarcticus]|uniref:WD40 repeat protein n=1 Tax=Ulvibacter antarcticus TaxID=442714 RepID=A0A3L9YA67_9FLAO|nr:OmpA family protein [Ulvibacter antarcticus]RMA57596.1 WD40 repeat protein [Ulvibacter antarcticus]